jgi:hypothetical protein
MQQAAFDKFLQLDAVSFLLFLDLSDPPALL